ncbi:LysM peptidoglycan-binding domain-containing protein [Psychrobacter sp. 16-MNA-CIBAN-0192]|uniref:LysM peptidoglycan-binding domain-containing protein n=1 Tax=Psychrobacter sp. 16-MNA-CIBAN-0192 TaxID=3140448 RepID=UPI00332C594E
MNFSRQALLGVGMIVGGIVMLFAMVQQLGNHEEKDLAPTTVSTADTYILPSTPLTIDVETEKRLLAQKQREREQRVANQEKQAELFSEAQASAESQALAKARSENQQYIDSSKPVAEDVEPKIEISQPKLQPRPAATVTPTDTTSVTAAQKEDAKKVEDKKEAPKAAVDYTIEKGDGLLKLSKQYNVSVAALAQANKIEPSATLQIGQVLTVPSRKQIERLEREAAAAEKVRAEKREAKRKKEEALAKKSVDARQDAQKKLSAARKEVKETDAKGSFGVQVALASNQASADELAKKFKAAGYEVKTSKTSRGVRVVVGPERGKLAALALKDKVNSDPDVNTTSAWVLYW